MLYQSNNDALATVVMYKLAVFVLREYLPVGGFSMFKLIKLQKYKSLLMVAGKNKEIWENYMSCNGPVLKFWSTKIVVLGPIFM